MPTSTSEAIARRRRAGFTLVELLVVVLLIAITASLAVVSLRTDERALVREEAARLAGSLRHMQDEAILTGATFAWRGEPLGYEYLRRGPDRSWLPLDADAAALSRRLPDPVRLVDIEVDGAKLEPGALLVLSPAGVLATARLTLEANRDRAAVEVGATTRVVTHGGS
jgi:general secretion pathway protein H